MPLRRGWVDGVAETPTRQYPGTGGRRIHAEDTATPPHSLKAGQKRGGVGWVPTAVQDSHNGSQRDDAQEPLTTEHVDTTPAVWYIKTFALLSPTRA